MSTLSRAPGWVPPPTPRRRARGRLIVVLVIVGAVVVVGSGIGAAFAVKAYNAKTTASPTPTWHSVFGDNTAAANAPAAEPATEAAPDPSYFNVAIGTPFMLSDHSGGAMTVTLTDAKAQKEGCDKYADKPTNGVYVVVTVTLEVTAGTMPINNLYFLWTDPSGNSDTYAIFSDCKGVPAADVPAGIKRTGRLAFDVASPHGAVEYDGPNGTPLGSWVIP